MKYYKRKKDLYLKNKETLHSHRWRKRNDRKRCKYNSILKRLCEFNDPWQLDDGIVDCFTSINNLQLIVDKAGFKRRPYRQGKFLKNLEELLAHEINYYSPRKTERTFSVSDSDIQEKLFENGSQYV